MPKTKELNGRELAGFIKTRQANMVSSFSPHRPRLVILRDNDNPVIQKYVNLKIRYGADIGVEVVDQLITDPVALKTAILKHNQDPNTHGLILQLPLISTDPDELTTLIDPKKDVDGLSGSGPFDSATATAILWLLNGYDIDLSGKKIAIVGHGRLVGAPLAKMLQASGFDPIVFRRGDDLTRLSSFNIIISATGSPRLIASDLVRAGATLVDAGTASENGVLLGDLDDSVRTRSDLLAITPKIGGVGPLTVAVLFDHLITAFQRTTIDKN